MSNQINVTGWKTYKQTDIWKVEYNETHTRITLDSTVTVTVTTTPTRYGTVLLSDWWLRPSKPMMFLTYNGNVIVMASGGVDTLRHRTITGSVTMQDQYFQIEWLHQGIH